MTRIALSLMALIMAPALLMAQAIGSMTRYPAFGHPTQVVETKTHVWEVSEGSLMSLDKQTDEVRHYMPGVNLSGSMVARIFPNDEAGYVLVSYADGNIDLLYPDGSYFNIPDIRDSALEGDKTINTVAFDGDHFYVGTPFGLVKISEKTGNVDEIGLYGFGVTMVEVLPDMVILSPAEGTPTYDHRILAVERGQSIEKISEFKSLGTTPYSVLNMVPLSSGPVDGYYPYLTLLDSYERMCYVRIPAEGQPKVLWKMVGFVQTICMAGYEGGGLGISQGKMISVKVDGSFEEIGPTPQGIEETRVDSRSGLSGLWIANIDGLGLYDYSDPASPKLLKAPVRVASSTSLADISVMAPAADGDGFLINNLGVGMAHPGVFGDLYDIDFKGDRVRADGTPERVKVPLTVSRKVNGGHKGKIASPTFVLSDLNDPDKYYIGSSLEGIYVVKNGEEIGKFDENSTMYKADNFAWRPIRGVIDKQGNLWVGVITSVYDSKLRKDTIKYPAVSVLPAAALRKDPSKVTRDDWRLIEDFGVAIGNKDMDILACRHSNHLFVTDRHTDGILAVLDHRGTAANLKDDKSVVLTSFIDQDGKAFQPANFYCLSEDHRGRVWVGTSNGLFEIADPASVFTPTFRINRLKVPRRDGTNLADYLLSSEEIRSIAVDTSNRKWIATVASGVFLVSENGDEVLANYNKDNSALPTNTVTQVYCDPNSNLVYVGTLEGLYVLASSSSPARPDYSDVYAYPNPVSPDYSGLITITGLMDDSMVKIVDSDMHLVAQTFSQGGMATWDGRDMNGSRVRTGVYYVLASSGDDVSSEGEVVTKILVVN